MSPGERDRSTPRHRSPVGCKLCDSEHQRGLPTNNSYRGDFQSWAVRRFDNVMGVGCEQRPLLMGARRTTGAAASRAQSPARLAADIPPDSRSPRRSPRTRGRLACNWSLYRRSRAEKPRRARRPALRTTPRSPDLVDGTGLRFEFLNERSERSSSPTRVTTTPAPPRRASRRRVARHTIEEII